MGSVIGGVLGYSSSKKQAKAAQNAADTQAESTRYASDMQKQMFDEVRADQKPYMQAGASAIGKMAGFNPSSYQGGGFSFNGSSNTGYSSRNLPSANQHSNYDGPEYGVGQFNFEESPSYQFRKQQGMDGIQSSAAAQGGLLSGSTLKALNNYNSNLASQEYGNAHNQYLQNEGLRQTEAQMGLNKYATEAGLQQQNFNNSLALENLLGSQHQQAFQNWQSQDNNAYNRYMTDQNNQYNRLKDLVGIGQNAAAGVGNAGMQTAQAVANNTMAGANAQAAGTIGAANARAAGTQALGGALGGLIGGVAGMYI